MNEHRQTSFAIGNEQMNIQRPALQPNMNTIYFQSAAPVMTFDPQLYYSTSFPENYPINYGYAAAPHAGQFRMPTQQANLIPQMSQMDSKAVSGPMLQQAAAAAQNPLPAQPSPAAAALAQHASPQIKKNKTPLFVLESAKETESPVAAEPEKQQQQQHTESGSTGKHVLLAFKEPSPPPPQPQPEGEVEEVSVEDPVNETYRVEFDRHLVPYKSETERKRYSREQLIEVCNHPNCKHKMSTEKYGDVHKMVKKGAHSKMKLPGFTFDVQASNIEKVEGAYVPSHLKEGKEAAVAPEKQLLKDLNAVLNRLMESNLAASLEEMKKLNLSAPHNVPILARAIFEMAVKQTKFATAFAKLTRQFWDLAEFKRELLEILRGCIEKPIEKHVEEANNGVDAELAKVTDATRRKILEERRETVLLKAEEAYFGTMTFMAELYTANMFSVQQLLNVINRFLDSMSQNSAKALILILGIAGKSLDQHERGKMDDIVKKLQQQLVNSQLPSYTVYHIEQLLKKRHQGWLDVKMGGGGPVSKPAGQQQQMDKKGVSSNSLISINPNNLSPGVEQMKPPSGRWNMGCGPAAGAGKQPRKTQQLTAAVPVSVFSVEQHNQGLRELEKHGDPVSLFVSKDSSYIESFSRSYKPAFVHYVVDKVFNKKREDRLHAGDMFVQLMSSSPPLTTEEIIEGFKHFCKLTDDLLEDFPKLFEYFPDILHRFLVASNLGTQQQQRDCDFVISVAREINENSADRKGLTVLMETIKEAATSVPPGSIAGKFSRSFRSHIVHQLGITDADLVRACAAHQCSFLLQDGPKISPPSAESPARQQQTQQNGSRNSALPANSTWATAVAPPQIAQRPVQPASAVPAPAVVVKTPAAQQEDGWVSAGSRKKGGRGGAGGGGGGAPRNSLRVDALAFMEVGGKLAEAEVIRSKLNAIRGDLEHHFKAFNSKLIRGLAAGRKESVGQYMELFHCFRMAHIDNQLALLNELNQVEMKAEQRKLLLDAAMQQKLLSKEAVSKWKSEAEEAAAAPLASLLKPFE